MRRKPIFPGFPLIVSMALSMALVWGCAVSQKTVVKPSGPPVPRLTATKQELLAAYNRQAESVTSLNAAVKLLLTAGSAYTGVIEQYHEVNGFILAQKPASIRVIGQAPVVGTNIFDMESDGETFHMFIPSRHKFLTGPANIERQSAKPIENLRPQHLTRAIFWEPVPAQALVLFEEASDAASQYYVLTVARALAAAAPGAPGADAAAPGDWEITSKIWFDRADLNVARLQTYEPGGKLVSDVRYSGWDQFGSGKYPRHISLARPGNDYKLEISVTRLTLGEVIAPDRFRLEQPPGSELVRVGEETQGTNP